MENGRSEFKEALSLLSLIWPSGITVEPVPNRSLCKRPEGVDRVCDPLLVANVMLLQHPQCTLAMQCVLSNTPSIKRQTSIQNMVSLVFNPKVPLASRSVSR